jgi:hypothetical protein
VTKHEFRTTGLSTASTSCVMRVSVPGTYVLRVPPSLVGGASDRLVSVDVADPQGASVELQRVD